VRAVSAAPRIPKRHERCPILPLAHPRTDAAAALGVSDDFFDEHVRPHLRAVYIGSLVLYPVHELQGWLDENARAVR
jgi:hypothetical protein